MLPTSDFFYRMCQYIIKYRTEENSSDGENWQVVCRKKKPREAKPPEKRPNHKSNDKVILYKTKLCWHYLGNCRY